MLSKKFAAVAGAVAAPSPTDYFNNTTLLLHGDGTNGAQNNSFVDSSSNNYTITPYGSSNQGSFSHIGDNWSNYFDGSSGLQTTTASTNNTIPTSTTPFTLEAWVYITSATTLYTIVSTTSTTYAYTLSLGSSVGQYNSTRKPWFGYYYAGAWYGTISPDELPLNTWTHVAGVFTGSASKIFVDGVEKSSGYPYTWGVVGGSDTIKVGTRNDGSNYFTGYISNARVVIGTAVYTSAFTPSTTPLTAITNTKFLSCQSNRFLDKSTYANAFTVSGTPVVQRFSPFNLTAEYSTSTIGGSGYFDGYSDYLTVPYNSTAFQFTGDFTIECWVNPTSRVSSYPALISNYSSYGANGLIGLFVGHALDSTKYSVSVNGSDGVLISTSTIKYKSWTHLAIVRSGSSMKLYVNGVAEATATNSTTITGTANNWWFGTAGDSPSNNGYNGYISNLRIIKGVAVYTGTFSPPALAPLGTTCANSTSAYSSTTNVNTSSTTGASLLLKFANAAIYDNAMMNNLETVGNAQVSTSVKKYGTGSMAFDGDTDYVGFPKNESVNLGSENFTIEFWAYWNSFGSDKKYCLSVTNGTNYWQFNHDSSSGIGFNYNNGGGQTVVISQGSNSGWSTGTWYHVALVRNGTTLTVYRNGASLASGTLSGSLTNHNTFCIGGSAGFPATTMNGYIDDFRITKGVARYTENFTPPTSSLVNN